MAGLSVPLANGAVMQLPPGFRFSPSEEELCMQYLRRRALNGPLPCAIISDIGIMHHNPWDLVPEGSTKERYYFTRNEPKYPGGRRTNRVAGKGYWKTTGTEAPIYTQNFSGTGLPMLVGMKRSLVFYRGNSLAGERTNWAMHEYRLAGSALAPCEVTRGANFNGSNLTCRCADVAMAKKKDDRATPLHAAFGKDKVKPDDSWVICRIYKKKKRAPRTIVEFANVNGRGNNVLLIDFMGPDNIEAHSPPSCITDTSAENTYEDHDISDMKGNDGKGN